MMGFATSWRAASLAASLVGAFSLASNQAEAIDFEDFCAESIQGSVHVFLVDQTELFDRVDRRRFEEGINRIFQGLRPGQRLDIYPMRDQPGALTPLVQMCVPGCPEELEDDESNWEQVCDRIGIQRAKRAFRSRFLQAAILLSNNNLPADGTELIRTIQQLGYEYRRGVVSRLTVFSDMLEYSDLNRRINSFDDSDAERLLRRARDMIDAESGLGGATVMAFGFGKRLGQQELLDQKREEFLAAGQSERSADALAEAQTVLPNTPRNAVRSFWERFFKELMEAPEARLAQNYQGDD